MYPHSACIMNGSSFVECFHVVCRVLSTDLKAFEQRLIECVDFARTCTRKWMGEQTTIITCAVLLKFDHFLCDFLTIQFF